MPTEYNPVLLVINFMTKITWYLKYFLLKDIHVKIFFKSSVANFYLC